MAESKEDEKEADLRFQGGEGGGFRGSGRGMRFEDR